jgi:hypothetical protein
MLMNCQKLLQQDNFDNYVWLTQILLTKHY